MKTDDEKTTAELQQEAKDGRAYLAICIPLLVPSLMWRGYVLHVLWEWFVTPAFSVAAPNLACIIGLLIVMASITPTRRNKDERPLADKVRDAIIYPAFGPTLWLSLGWVTHRWM